MVLSLITVGTDLDAYLSSEVFGWLMIGAAALLHHARLLSACKPAKICAYTSLCQLCSLPLLLLCMRKISTEFS